MTVQRTLLERLRDPAPAGYRRSHVSTTEVFESVLGNVQRLLNTCQGNCLTDPEYGLPHMTSVRSTMPDSVAGFTAAIRRSIERYEPRLNNVRVRHAPHGDGGLELRFEISGFITDEDERTSVRFETYADDEGRLVVR
ncbi:MAG: type VI secretion system baseplate subunit TssE [Planctomycetes bacterium]|nr:type VI secretion system baseplate subunit TssE [Planctomycetota bacterium]